MSKWRVLGMLLCGGVVMDVGGAATPINLPEHVMSSSMERILWRTRRLNGTKPMRWEVVPGRELVMALVIPRPVTRR